MCHGEIENVDAKIAALQRVRESLSEELVNVRDEELALIEERAYMLTRRRRPLASRRAAPPARDAGRQRARRDREPGPRAGASWRAFSAVRARRASPGGCVHDYERSHVADCGNRLFRALRHARVFRRRRRGARVGPVYWRAGRLAQRPQRCARAHQTLWDACRWRTKYACRARQTALCAYGICAACTRSQTKARHAPARSQDTARALLRSTLAAGRRSLARTTRRCASGTLRLGNV